jgi:hypothetical protein
MQLIDASSIIYAWDNYPINQFPSFWAWLAEEVHGEMLTMPQPVFEEVSHNSPECHSWLKQNGMKILPVTNFVLIEAL